MTEDDLKRAAPVLATKRFVYTIEVEVTIVDLPQAALEAIRSGQIPKDWENDWATDPEWVVSHLERQGRILHAFVKNENGLGQRMIQRGSLHVSEEVDGLYKSSRSEPSNEDALLLTPILPLLSTEDQIFVQSIIDNPLGTETADFALYDSVIGRVIQSLVEEIKDV